MIHRIGTLFFAALLSGAANAECRFDSGETEIHTDDIPDAIIALLDINQQVRVEYDETTGEYTDIPQSPRGSFGLFPGKTFAAYEDLDGNGSPESCYHLSTTATCSNGVGICQHVVMSDDGETVLLNTATHILTPLQWPIREGTRMLQSVDVRNDGDLWSTLYRFSEGQYHADTAVPLGPLFPKDN